MKDTALFLLIVLFCMSALLSSCSSEDDSPADPPDGDSVVSDDDDDDDDDDDTDDPTDDDDDTLPEDGDTPEDGDDPDLDGDAEEEESFSCQPDSWKCENDESQQGQRFWCNFYGEWEAREACEDPCTEQALACQDAFSCPALGDEDCESDDEPESDGDLDGDEDGDLESCEPQSVRCLNDEQNNGHLYVCNQQGRWDEDQTCQDVCQTPVISVACYSEEACYAPDYDPSCGQNEDGDEEMDLDGDEDDDTLDGDLDDETSSCLADETLSYTGSHSLTLTPDQSVLPGSYCGLQDLQGTQALVLLRFVIPDSTLRITATPQNGQDIALSVLDACQQTPLCLEQVNNTVAGEAESLLWRNGSEYREVWIAVHHVGAGDSGSVNLEIDSAFPQNLGAAELCDYHADCNPSTTAGLCVGDGFRFCTTVCEDAEDCTDFPGGCCREVDGRQGQYCIVGSQCGDDANIGLPGDACYTEEYYNLPGCDTGADAEFCLNQRLESYCSASCNDENDCPSPLACCVNQQCLTEQFCSTSCHADELIARSSDELHLSGTLVGMDNDVHPYACLSGGAPGGDRVFSLELSAGETLSANLTPQGFDAVFYVTRTCGWFETGSCEAVANEVGVGEAESLLVVAEETDTYYLVVDGASFGDEGSFNLDLTISQPLVDGDEELEWDEEFEDELEVEEEQDLGPCGSAVAVDLSSTPVVMTGDSSLGLDEFYSPSCAFVQYYATEGLYRVILQAGDVLTVTVSDVSFNPAIFAYSNCDENACLSMAENAISGGEESLTLSSPTGGAYLIVVDGQYPSDVGSYTITFDLAG